MLNIRKTITTIIFKTLSLLSIDVKADNYLEKGLMLFHTHKYKEALREFNTVIKKEPNNTIAYLDKGVLLSYIGRYIKKQ